MEESSGSPEFSQEQVAQNSEFCPTRMRAFNANADVIRLRCKQWKCDVCRKGLSHYHARRVRYGIALWPGEAYFWTFTLPGHIKNQAFGFRVLRHAWKNLRQSVYRYYGEFQYAAFVEIHPKRQGVAHFHIVSLCPCPGRIKDVAVHAGLGHQATEAVIDGGEAAYYVAKYTSKQGDNMPKGFRRVRYSREWPSLPKPLYDTEIYPMQKGEILSDYLRRISANTGTPFSALLILWNHPEYDL
jgi:hypothetical protein